MLLWFFVFFFQAPSAAPTNIWESNIDQRNGNILSDLEKGKDLIHHILLYRKDKTLSSQLWLHSSYATTVFFFF